MTEFSEENKRDNLKFTYYSLIIVLIIKLVLNLRFHSRNPTDGKYVGKKLSNKYVDVNFQSPW